MKKILMLFLVLIIILSTKNVYAQDQYELTLEKHEDIYYSRYGKEYSSYPFMVFKFGDIFAYCIEPGNHITTYTYVEGELDPGYSQEKLEKLELIGYYGREYPSHDNVRYSMATQALIWELTGADKVTFWTKKNEGGEEIDVSKEKKEIMDLVNNHYKTPNFNSQYETTLNHEIILEDSNNVLSNYDVITIHDAYIEGNKLHIMPKKACIDNIKLIRKNYSNDKTIIFVGKDDSNTQKMARLHFSKEIKKEVVLLTKGIRVIVHKIDENNNPIKISNIKFKVSNLIGYYICSGNTDCIHKTDEDGIFITEQLHNGVYQIEEVEDQIIPGYTWNKEKLTVTIDDKTPIKYSDELGSYIDVFFTNKSVNGTLEINKLGEEVEIDNNEIKYKEKELSNIEFEIYDENNKVINTITTNEKGYSKATNLLPGKYYMKEKTKLDNYKEIDKIEFELKQENQYQEIINISLVIKNILKKGKLDFTKLDKDTNLGISNTIIEIYNEFDVLLFTKETDEFGKITIDNLPYGKYYIKEKQPNYLYQKTDEIINFEIKEDGEVIKKTLTNKKIVGDLEITKLGETYNFIDNTIIYDKEPLSNITFSIYDIYDNFIADIKTDDNGYTKYTLPLGKYYFIEKSTIDKYVTNNDKYYFEINKDGNTGINVKKEIVNYLKKGDFEFSKEDLITGEGIDNTIIEIYDNDNNLLMTRKTNELGKVFVNNLPLGKYYIIEKEANSLYMITNEKVYFEIKEDGEVIKANLINEKIEVPVEKTNTNEDIIAHSLFSIIFLIGIGRMYYERKESF